MLKNVEAPSWHFNHGIVGLKLCKAWKKGYISAKVQYLFSSSHAQSARRFVFQESQIIVKSNMKEKHIYGLKYQLKMHAVRILVGFEWKSGGEL